MKQRASLKVFLVVGLAGAALGFGAAQAAPHKKTVGERVTELEGKVKTLELQMQTVMSELARTPRLGMQTAK